MLCLLMVASVANAEVLESPGRLWFSVGAAYRDHQQILPDGTLGLRIGGAGKAIAPWNLHLSTALFFNKYVGIDFEARSELFFATQSGVKPVPQPSSELTGLVPVRFVIKPWLSVEGQIGWSLLQRSIIRAGPAPADFLFTGPSFGVAVGFSPSHLLVSQLYFRLTPVSISLAGIPSFTGSMFAGGAQVSVGALRIGETQLGFAITLEANSTRVTSENGVAQQFGLRLGFGGALMRAPAEVEVQQLPPEQAKVRLEGKVVSAEGAPITGAVVTLDGESPVQSDANGGFAFPTVAPGAHVLRGRKDGFQAGQLDVKVAQGQTVTLTLEAATGPGKIRGVIKSEGKPVANAALTAGDQSVVSDAEGRYSLEKVGPGPVSVKVKAAGFNDAEEVAQVPPEADAQLDFTLIPKAVEVRATLRGLIRAKSGDTLKATVRVVELKLKLQVKADGRFSAEVPSGKYTLIIDAKGYLTQTKTVEVSGGDQAIFAVELERLR